jgi:hypothetical protein
MGIIKNAFIGIALVAGISGTAVAQFGDMANKAQGAMGMKKGGGLSQDDIASGLREALKVGAKNATNKVSATDGFYGNPLIKVLMPPEAKKVENTLRNAGMGDRVDKLILSMNRGAEDASSKALQIFVDAILSMSIEDGLKILQGSNDAATQYLKARTTEALTKAFRPVIKESLDKVGATQMWADVFTTYNHLPTTFKKVNPDLAGYVTERALNGVFVYIAVEEAKIRTDPAAQVNDILKKVFGSH